uniref:Uncharacterized protein n=1 Tax=Arundo donax TaxID=35708 RepID=A0A0A8YY96_ARUDO
MILCYPSLPLLQKYSHIAEKKDKLTEKDVTHRSLMVEENLSNYKEC